MDENELKLGFDITPFQEGIDKVTKEFNTFLVDMVKKTKQADEKSGKFQAPKKIKNDVDLTSKSIKGFQGAMFKAMFLFEIFKRGIGMLMQGVRKLMAEIPEIGMTFKIAGDIIMKELAYPIRKVLIPYLQKILDWVRDSRGMFLMWGTVIANAVKGVILVIKTGISLVKEFMSGLFGDTGKNFTEFINVAIFKITMFLMIVGEKLKPIAKAIGGVFNSIIKAVGKFIKGFMESMNLMDTDTFKDLQSILEKIKKVIDILAPAFEVLGKVIGTVFGAGLKFTLSLLNYFLTDLLTLIDAITGKISIEDFSKRTQESNKAFLKSVAGIGKVVAKDWGSWADKTFGGKKKARDAVIQGGNIISTDPQDVIYAVKGGLKDTGKSVNVTVGNIPITLNVTEGNAKNAGMNFAQGLSNNLRYEILNDWVLTGGR